MVSTRKPPRSRPATEATANTDPMRPMYRPRARGGTMSAMMACAPTISPPAPIPCTARKPMSSHLEGREDAWREPGELEDRRDGGHGGLVAAQQQPVGAR